MSLDAGLLSLVDGRSGHVLLESGHHGELWLELDTLFLRPALLTPLVEDLAARLVAAGQFDAICGPLLGGAFIANAIAALLAREFYISEPAATGSTGPLFSARYSVPAPQRGHLPGKRVVVVDDVVNAGSATRATVADLRAAGAVVVGVGALLVLGPHAGEYTRAEDLFLARGAEVPNRIWEPSECPLCRAGQALERPGGR